MILKSILLIGFVVRKATRGQPQSFSYYEVTAPGIGVENK